MPDKKAFFVGRIKGNQCVSAYIEVGETKARKRFEDLIEDHRPLEVVDVEEAFKAGVFDLPELSIVVHLIDTPIPESAFCHEEREFFSVNGVHQQYLVAGQTRSMIANLTYGARKFSLIIDQSGIVMANGHLNGSEPRDPVSEQGFLWIDPFYLRENYEGEGDCPTDELQLHTYDYRPGASGEPVFSATVNFETGAVEDRTEK